MSFHYLSKVSMLVTIVRGSTYTAGAAAFAMQSAYSTSTLHLGGSPGRIPDLDASEV